MNRRRAQLQRLEQINILQTSTRQRHTRKEWTRLFTGLGILLVLLLLGGFFVQLGVNALLEKTLYASSQYSLQEIQIEPRDHFSTHLVRETAGLDIGQNLWTLNLPKIALDLQTLPNVSAARVERHFPNKIIIRLTERIPVVKLMGMNIDLGTREMFYLDRDGFVLKPRANDPPMDLPEIVGLSNVELEVGKKLDRPILKSAIRILDAIEASPLRTSVNIRTIDLSKPLFLRVITTHDAYDTAITFRLDCIHQQLERMQQILDKANALQRTVRTVDLSLERYVPVSFYE